MNSRSMGDLNKIYQFSEDITESRARILVMMYNEYKRGSTVNKKRSYRIENLQLRINKLTLMRHDEIMRVYSNVTLSRNMSPLPPLTSRSRQPVTLRQPLPPILPPSTRSVTSSQSSSSSSLPRPVTPPQPLPPILPLKITHIDKNEPNVIVIDMGPNSFKPNTKIDEEDDIIYPEGVTDFRPYKTVARYRKAIGKSTNFRVDPLLVGENSTETLVLGLEHFAQQHGCDLSFTDEDLLFDKSVYRAAEGIANLGSIHLLATDSLLTANFQFELDLGFDSKFDQSQDNIENFVLGFCEAISKVLTCENNNVRVFSINKLIEESGKSQVNIGLTTSNPERTEQLAQDLQTYARSGFATDTILGHVKPGEYECKWKSALRYLQVRPSDFAPEFNFDYRDPGVPTESTRGSHPYYLPIGWYRHALNVLHKYGINPTWLGCVDAEGEWPVAFHGTHSGAVNSIVQEGLSPSAAKTDAMIQEAIQQMGEEVNRPGLYVATHCNGGSYPRYTRPFTVTTFPGKSEQFSIVFQCRVQPGKFTTHTSPVLQEGKAWRIVDPNAVRPYGILLKKEDSSEKEETT